jgi:hypothetical protein
MEIYSWYRNWFVRTMTRISMVIKMMMTTTTMNQRARKVYTRYKEIKMLFQFYLQRCSVDS